MDGLDYNVDEEDAENPNDRQRIKAESSVILLILCDTKLALGVSFKLLKRCKIFVLAHQRQIQKQSTNQLEQQPYYFSRKVLSDLFVDRWKFGDEFADVEADADLYEEIYGLSEFNTLSETGSKY